MESWIQDLVPGRVLPELEPGLLSGTIHPGLGPQLDGP